MEDGDDENDATPADLKLAQALTGELSWVSSRSRPDLAYVTGLMSRILHRRPKYTAYLGMHAMRYLHRTQDDRLRFRKSDENKLNTLQVFVDTSFGPPHEKYRSIQGMLFQHGENPLMWASTRQPFVAQSTSEGELLVMKVCKEHPLCQQCCRCWNTRSSPISKGTANRPYLN